MILAKGEIEEYFKHYFKNKTIFGTYKIGNLEIRGEIKNDVEFLDFRNTKVDMNIVSYFNLLFVNIELDLLISSYRHKLCVLECRDVFFGSGDRHITSLPSSDEIDSAFDVLIEEIDNNQVVKEMLLEHIRKGLTFIRKLK